MYMIGKLGVKDAHRLQYLGLNYLYNQEKLFIYNLNRTKYPIKKSVVLSLRYPVLFSLISYEKYALT